MQNKTKSMLLLIAMLVIGFFLGALSSGAIRHHRGERIARMSPEEQFRNAMTKIIKPSEEQQRQIELVLKSQDEKIAVIQQKRTEEFIAVLDSTRAELDALLTDEQKEKLEAHMEKAVKEQEERQLKRLTRVLDLTEEQQQQLKNIFEEKPKPGSKEKMLPFKKGNIKKLKGKREELDKKIEAILTPEQIEKFQNFRNSPRERFKGPGGPPGMPRGGRDGFKGHPRR